MIINFLLLFQVLNLIAGFFKAEKAIDLLHFSKVSRNMYDYFFYEEKIPIFPLEIQISTEVAKGENLSRYFFEIIFAKTLNKDKYDEDELYKNSYILRFNLSKDKKVPGRKQRMLKERSRQSYEIQKIYKYSL